MKPQLWALPAQHIGVASQIVSLTEAAPCNLNLTFIDQCDKISFGARMIGHYILQLLNKPCNQASIRT